MKPTHNYTILDVGVTSDDQHQDSNFFEKMYPHKKNIVCVGIEDGSHLEEKYPGVQYVKIFSGKPLPFNNKKFDIAFSNAVIEHVGNAEAQKTFVKEIIRVSKQFFITTPNRWFPVEFHTALPILHWLPKKLYRKVLSVLGEKYWNKEENLNLLSKREFSNLFPKDTQIVVDSIGILGYSTNFVIYGNS